MLNKSRNITRAFAALALLAAIGAPAYAQGKGKGQPQASITLTNCSGDDCYVHDNTWTIDKSVKANTVVDGQGTVTWTVTATKDSSAAATYSVHGGVTVTNTGSAPATIGNIVVNLQKPNSPKKGSNAPYVSIAANVANATAGDAATSANIVAAGSQENAATNALWGTNNYTISGAQGTFTETSCSGSLEFTDASNNTVFSLTPQPVIPVGESITLLYHADFNVACLPAAGTTLRVEALVTFGNAGERGGSGSSATDIDIDGSGGVSNDEKNVRTVPCRETLGALSAPEEVNDSVTVTDAGATTTGTVTTSNPLGFDAFPATVSADMTWDVSVDVVGGTDGGKVCNTASLLGEADGGTLSTIVGYEEDEDGNLILDELGQPIPIYATFTCADAAEAEDSSCVDVTVDEGDCPECVEDGDYCSFSQGGFGGQGAPFNLLSANFGTIYPTGVEAGIPGVGGFSMTFTTATAVQAYLPAGGGSNKLTADLVNPTSTVSGNLGGQVLTLKLNIGLSDASVTNPGFGDLYYCDATSSLTGLTARQILAAAETALGGGAVPAGYTYTTLQSLIEKVATSFDLKDDEHEACGVATPFALQFLKKTACQ